MFQWLLRDSDKERNNSSFKVSPEFGERIWSTKPYHPYYSPDRFIEAAKNIEVFWEENFWQNLMIRCGSQSSTRKIYDKEDGQAMK